MVAGTFRAPSPCDGPVALRRTRRLATDPSPCDGQARLRRRSGSTSSDRNAGRGVPATTRRARPQGALKRGPSALLTPFDVCPICLPWNKRQRERSDRRRMFHGRWAWLGRRRTRRAAQAKRRAGFGALAWNKRQSERRERRRLFHTRWVWLGRRRTRRTAAAKRRAGYGAVGAGARRRAGEAFGGASGLDACGLADTSFQGCSTTSPRHRRAHDIGGLRRRFLARR